MNWKNSKQQQRRIRRERKRSKGRPQRRPEGPRPEQPDLIDEELSLISAPTVAALAFPMIFGGAFEVREPKPRREILILDPLDGATVAIETLVRVYASGLEEKSRLFVLIDQLWVSPGEFVEMLPGRVMIAPGRSDALIILEEGRHTLCVQAADSEGRAIDLFDLIEVKAIAPKQEIR